MSTLMKSVIQITDNKFKETNVNTSGKSVILYSQKLTKWQNYIRVFVVNINTKTAGYRCFLTLFSLCTKEKIKNLLAKNRMSG